MVARNGFPACTLLDTNASSVSTMNSPSSPGIFLLIGETPIDALLSGCQYVEHTSLSLM